MKDYYRILGLTPVASEQQIKSAYRKLVMRHHPDRATSARNDEFHEVREAYEVLSDPDSRHSYDVKTGFINWRKDKVDVYQQNQVQSENKFRPKSSPKATFTVLNDNASANQRLHEINTDTERDVSQPKTKSNSTRANSTRGSTFIGKIKDGVLTAFDKGSHSGDSPSDPADNKTTRARGTVVSNVPDERIFFITIDALQSITGTSQEIALEEHAGTRMIRVKIPPGVKSGSSLKVNCPETELYPARIIRVKIDISPHQLVEREGLDVVVKIPITVSEAVNGCSLEVPVPDGSIIVKVPPDWSDGKRLRVKDKGVCDSISGETGDLYVQTSIVIPKELEQDSTDSTSSDSSGSDLSESDFEPNIRAHIPKKF